MDELEACDQLRAGSRRSDLVKADWLALTLSLRRSRTGKKDLATVNTPTGSQVKMMVASSGRYSGGLEKVTNPDPKADALAKKLGGESRIKFKNDPAGREFDVVSDQYIGQTNVGKQTINQ